MIDCEDQLQKLQEKLLKALQLFKQARQEKLALQRELEKIKGEFREGAGEPGANEREYMALRREREEVRLRVEKLLHRIEALTTPESRR